MSKSVRRSESDAEQRATRRPNLVAPTCRGRRVVLSDRIINHFSAAS